MEVGTYNKDLFEEKIKPNKYSYAAFGVVDYLEDTVPAGIREQVGTFKPIGNPFAMTVLKTVALNRLNELQAAKNTVRDWMKENFAGEIGEGVKLDPHHQPPRAGPNREHLTILEDGKPVAYEVDQYIAKMFQRQDIGTIPRNLARYLGAATYFRHPLYITGSPGFQLTNVFRDLRRTWVNLGALYGTSFRDVLKAYWAAKGPAWRRARGIDDPTIEQMLKEKALDTPFSKYQFSGDADADEQAYARLLAEYHITDPEKARGRLAATFVQIWKGVETVGNFIEAVPKVAGFRVIESSQGGYDADGVPQQERSYQVRNFVGTPNLRRRGTATDLSNSALIYSNAMIQGARADAELAAYRPTTRAGWAMRRTLIDVMPRVLQKAAVAGLFGAGVKALLDRVPDFDKANYTVIPLGATGEGEEKKTAYLRLPHDETGRLLGSIVWEMLDSPASGLWKGIERVVDVGYGGTPGFSPIITEGYNWAQFARGEEPRGLPRLAHHPARRVQGRRVAQMAGDAAVGGRSVGRHQRSHPHRPRPGRSWDKADGH